MMFHRIVSALLLYPDAELREALPELGAAVAGDDDLSPGERQALTAFVERLAAADPTQAEADYVATFDMVPEHSLHLTHHLIGEDKNRGPALIDLGQYYEQFGLSISRQELPDYLPAILEFASLLDAAAARAFLGRWSRVLCQLAANLEEAGSAYAPVLRLIIGRAEGAADARVEGVPAERRDDPCLADGDFDPPVDWSAPAACNAERPSVLPLVRHPRPSRGKGQVATDY